MDESPPTPPTSQPLPKHTLHLLFHSYKTTPSHSETHHHHHHQHHSASGLGSDELATNNCGSVAKNSASLESDAFEQSLQDISDQVSGSSGLVQAACLAQLVVESAVVSNEHLAFLLEDGQVCRIAYQIVNQTSETTGPAATANPISSSKNNAGPNSTSGKQSKIGSGTSPSSSHLASVAIYPAPSAANSSATFRAAQSPLRPLSSASFSTTSPRFVCL